VPENDLPMTDEPRKGLSRRQMIAAAGVAGAAAWTAPVIIDSLSSPAAAETHPTGTYSFEIRKTGNSACTVVTGTAYNTTCVPTGWTAAISDPALFGITATCNNGSNQIVVNQSTTDNCKFTAAGSGTSAVSACGAGATFTDDTAGSGGSIGNSGFIHLVLVCT
jgi:hypothetical protein